MSIRIIVRTDDANMAANVGGSVYTSYKTFLIENNLIEDFLTRHNKGLSHAQIVGTEIVKEEESK